MLKNPDRGFLLCHGYPIYRGHDAAPGEHIGHAWIEVEVGGDWFVIDALHQLSPFPREFYYGVGGIREAEVRRYTDEQVYVHMIRSRHYGPWETGHEPSGALALVQDANGRWRRKRTTAKAKVKSKRTRVRVVA
jgi:hypothetical protein